jgi:HEAT repeat protein
MRTAELKVVFSRWVDDLLSPDETTRKAAHRLLTSSGERAADVMIDSLTSRSAQHQWRILPILGDIGTEKALRAVAACLHSDNSAIVAAAAQVLGRSGSTIAAELMLAHVQSMHAEDEAASVWIIATLGQLKEARAVPYLVDVLHKTQNTTVRYTTIEALGKIGDRRVLPDICRYMDDHSHHVRDKVQLAIERLTHS